MSVLFLIKAARGLHSVLVNLPPLPNEQGSLLTQSQSNYNLSF